MAVSLTASSVSKYISDRRARDEQEQRCTPLVILPFRIDTWNILSRFSKWDACPKISNSKLWSALAPSTSNGVQLRGAVAPRAAKQLEVERSDALEEKRKELGITPAQLLCLAIMFNRPWCLPTKSMAVAMNIEPNTVPTHIKGLIQAFNAADKWDMLEKAAAAGFAQMKLLSVTK